ncbi:hypothetical protein [Chondrinema litorale]|uniref:hypothetical protein n=1 Tax=Chondrinema litorale TaxID=2994555 RepID=UPI0025429F69|nr:hypothetical protein [Chondrinema litorale]UZR98961.1 hypothetical protein OQ292_34490 [Chondrinema litorale]
MNDSNLINLLKIHSQESAPDLLKAYQNLHKLFIYSSFNINELTVIWITLMIEHSYHNRISTHNTIPKAMNIDNAITYALRNETELPSKKLEAVRTLTLLIVRNRGEINSNEIKAFLNAGFNLRQVFEIILGLAKKTIYN